jgi:DNA polymerase-4
VSVSADAPRGDARRSDARRNDARRNDARAVLHIDMDAFYASVEERDRPELKGKPLIVGGIRGRGVVAAASYAVRKFGVTSAMPMREALRRCPQAVCVAPRMGRYQEVSGQVFAIFEDFTPLVEGL